MQGLVDTEATMKAYAEAVFDANATPQVRINAVTVRVDGTADLATKAHRDLYDKVRITNTAAGLDQTARVTALTHRITPRSWLVEMTFGKDGGVAAPQVTPALVSTPTTPDPVPTAWAPLTLAAPFTAGSPTPAYRMDAAGNVHLRGVVTVNTGTNGALVFTLPTGFRPTDQWSVPVRTNASNVVQRLIVLASGNATINWAGTAPTTFGLETVFSTL